MSTNTKAFIHAALVAEYAEDCKVSETPWEFWEWHNGQRDEWSQCVQPVRFVPHEKYRRKVQTMWIGEHEFPEPMRRRPDDEYFYVNLNEKDFYSESFWTDDENDRHRFENGFIHATAEAAELHGKALASFTRRDA